MTQVPSLSDHIRDLIAQRQPGYTLPQAFYTDQDIFDLDLDRIFRRHWIPAGSARRIPEKGQWYTFEIDQDSIIITRGFDDQVHAMHNVCRHRGSRVCYEQEGQGKGLVCPYHAWAYALDGTLLGAGAMPCEFDKSEHGLKQIPVKVYHGTVMIYLGEGDPPDISDVENDIDPMLSIFELDKAKMAARMVWDIPANWKLVVENFAECYHCGPAHPEYCSVMAVAQPGTTGAAAHKKSFDQMTRDWETYAKSLGHPTGKVDTSDSSIHTCSRIPIGEGKLSQSKGGKQIAPTMGRFKANDGGITAARIHPANYWINACDHAVSFRFTPIAPQKTIQEVTWLVHPDAVEGRDYRVEELTWLWNVTTEQDKMIIVQNQKGVNSSAYEPGPYSSVEFATNYFVNWYLDKLQA